jgi:hypothetical protein
VVDIVVSNRCQRKESHHKVTKGTKDAQRINEIVSE